MTIEELIRANKSLFDILHINKIDANNVEYIELMEIYRKMCSDGHKKLYIYHYLADIYGMDARSVRRIIGRMGKTVAWTLERP